MSHEAPQTMGYDDSGCLTEVYIYISVSDKDRYIHCVT